MWRRVFNRSLAAGYVGRRLARMSAGRLLVLCYHDLREAHDFTSWLRVDVSTFRDHIEALSRLGEFVTPFALANPHDLSPERLHFLLTFDDGYANNLRLAADALEQAGAPALFFVSTHHMMTGEPFWFDRVINRVQAAALRRLDLSSWGLRDYRFASKDGARRWEGIQLLLADLKSLGNPTEPAVAAILDHLDAQYGAAAEPYEARFRPITQMELKTLARRPGAFVGSHGHCHELLTRLDAETLTQSVLTSRNILKELVDQPVDDIAYPNGNEDRRVRDAVQSAGYQRAYLARGALVPKRPDLLGIPRLLVGGYDTARDVIASVNLARLAAAREAA